MSEHLSNNGKNTAHWGASHSKYRKSAITGIKAKANRKNVYDNMKNLEKNLKSIEWGTNLAYPAGSTQHCNNYKLDKFKADNAGSPYPNQAHHIIPANDFINFFDSDQQEILRKIDYDVNNQNNLIFLPANDNKYKKIHMLPWHNAPGGHKKYSKQVKSSAQKIKNAVNEEIDKQEKCKAIEISDKITKELVAYENKLWEEIVKLGPSTINKIKIPQR